MSRRTAPLLPATEELLRQFGERLRLARLRRQLSAKQVAERAGMTTMTLRGLERGGSGVTIGAYLAVMQVLGIEEELNHLAEADPVGRSLQDASLTRVADAHRAAAESLHAVREPIRKAIRSRETRSESPSTSQHDASNWLSSRELAGLLAPRPKKRPSSKAKRR